jgi:hypothetical protein
MDRNNEREFFTREGLLLCPRLYFNFLARDTHPGHLPVDRHRWIDTKALF